MPTDGVTFVMDRLSANVAGRLTSRHAQFRRDVRDEARLGVPLPVMLARNGCRELHVVGVDTVVACKDHASPSVPMGYSGSVELAARVWIRMMFPVTPNITATCEASITWRPIDGTTWRLGALHKRLTWQMSPDALCADTVELAVAAPAGGVCLLMNVLGNYS